MKMVEVSYKNYYRNHKWYLGAVHTYPKEYMDVIIKYIGQFNNNIYWFNGKHLTEQEAKNKLFQENFIDKL